MPQPLDVPPARFNGHVIVGRAVKDSNWSSAHLFIFEVSSVALRVKRNVCSKLEASRSMHLLEALETGIQRHTASFGKAHHGDARSVDSRVFREQLECSIGVHNHGEVPESRLVRDRLEDASSRKAI